MKGLKRWRFFAGLIIFFAGLDVTLLLSHLSRLLGVILLFVGAFLIISSHPNMAKKTKELLPDFLVEFFLPENLARSRYPILFALIAISIPVFISETYLLITVLILLAVPELLLRFLNKESTTNILLSMEFQLFVFVSTAVYLNFSTIFGYRDPPEIFPQFFLLSVWVLELVYIFNHLKPTKEEKPHTVSDTEDDGTPYLSERFVHLLTLNGRLKPFMPLAGIGVILMVFVFNLFIKTGEFSFGSHDGVTLLLGLALILYNYIPKTYAFERDFSLLFFVFLFLILVLPITIITYYSGPLTEESNSPVIYHLLARPTAGLLRLLGIDAQATIRGEWVIIRMFMPTSQSIYPYTNVRIGLSCTGLYSVSIFISAFMAFVMVHFKRFTRKLSFFMALGIFASWVANVLRMTIIMLMGYWYGIDAMMWTHNNAGIFIFMVWVALFWGVMFKFFDIPVGRE